MLIRTAYPCISRDVQRRDEIVNIVMIGDSAVGKTTLMMSIYGLMVNGDIGGFRAECRNKQAHNKLTRAYNDFRTDGKYPAATVKMSTYDYDFYSDNDWVMNFSLTDIRGESIHDYNVDDLSEQLRAADAMMLFLNGYDVAKGEDVSDQIDEINILLNNCFIADHKEKLIMIIFSQIDRIDNFSGQTWEMLNDTVSELKKMTDRNPDIAYMAIPTACSLDCMMDLDFTMVTLMLFGYRTEVLQRRQQIEDELESIQKQYGEGIVRFFIDTLGLDLERNKARARYAELQKELPEYDKMVEKFNRLQKFYDDYEVGTSYKIQRRWSSKMEDPFDL